jgi:hypothetical protein
MFLLTVWLLLAQLASQVPAPVTNQTVLDMVAAKLPADLIVTKVQTSQTNFDLSTDALVKLTQGGCTRGRDQSDDAEEQFCRRIAGRGCLFCSVGSQRPEFSP